MLRKILKFLLITISAIFLLGCALIGGLIYMMHIAPFRGSAFNATQWEAAMDCKGLSDGLCAQKESECSRGPMVKSLSRKLAGQPHSKVLSLIGTPTSSHPLDGDQCDLYRLGMCSGLGWDYDSFYVCLDDTGVVYRTGTIQH